MSNTIEPHHRPTLAADRTKLDGLEVRKSQLARSASSSVSPSDAYPPRITAPASEKVARLAELEISTANQRDRLQTARRTQEFLHHDRETGYSYHLIDGTLVQGSYRGGETKVDPGSRRGSSEGSLQFEIRDAKSQSNESEQLRSDTEHRRKKEDDAIRRHIG